MKNEKLHEKIGSLTKAAYKIYSENFGYDNPQSDDSFDHFIQLGRHDQTVRNLPDFKKCVELMTADPKIAEIQGKLVGTHLSSTIVRNEEECIYSFLKQTFLKNPKYSKDSINHAYAKFEDLFYSDELELLDTTALYNFIYDGIEIKLDDEICIKRSSHHAQKSRETDRLGYPAFSKSSFTIERRYGVPKQIGSSNSSKKNKPTHNKTDTSNEAIASRVTFDQVIASLRILKHSAIYRDPEIRTEILTFHPSGGAHTRRPFYENMIIGKKLTLAQSDATQLQNIFNYVKSYNHGTIAIAIRRLVSGTERRLDEDKLIDYMIGFESLYLPDGNAELTFRLSLRASFHLTKSNKERKEIFKFLKKMYGIRSKVVHGNKYKLENTDIEKLEDMLRETIKLRIEDQTNPGRIEASELDEDKELGQDSLFFE